MERRIFTTTATPVTEAELSAMSLAALATEFNANILADGGTATVTKFSDKKSAIRRTWATMTPESDATQIPVAEDSPALQDDTDDDDQFPAPPSPVAPVAPAPTQDAMVTCYICGNSVAKKATFSLVRNNEQVFCCKRVEDCKKPSGLAAQAKAATTRIVAQETAKTEARAQKSAPAPRQYKHADTAVITVLSASNPKKAGTASYDRFALYRTGMTVAQALTAGVTRADLDWDSNSKRNFIVIA